MDQRSLSTTARSRTVGSVAACVLLIVILIGPTGRADTEEHLLQDDGRIASMARFDIPDYVRGMTSQCSVCFSPNGELLAATCGKNRVPIWRVATGEIVHLLYDEPIQAVACSFSPDGSVLATAGVDGAISLWDPVRGVLLGTIGEGLSFVWDLAFSEDGTRLISCSLHGAVDCWHLASGERIWRYSSRRGYLSVDAGPGLAAFGSLRDGAGLIDLATGDVARHWTDPTDHVGDVAISPDGSLLAAGCDDDWIYLWETEAEQPPRILAGHDGYVNGVAFTPDGMMLVSGCHDGTVGLWDVASGDLLRMLDGHEDAVLRVAINPQGTRIASASWDGTVRLWGVSPTEGEEL